MESESLDRVRTQKGGVAVVVALTVALIATLLVLMSLNYRDAVNAHELVASAHDRDRMAQRAETLFWREREAMNEYLLSPRPEILLEIRSLRSHFDNVLLQLGESAANARQQQEVQAAATAHALFIREFQQRRPEAGLGVAPEDRVVAFLRRLEPTILTPLDSIAPLDGREEATQSAAAHDANRRALTAGILAALTAVVGGVLFSFYAVRLIGRIRAQNAKLRALDKLKDDFVASVSHELRTPLTSIRGYVELLLTGEAGELTEEQERFLTVVDRNADRLLNVVGDLLFVSQVEAGVIALEPRLFELVGLVKEAVDAARPAAEAQGIELQLNAAAVAVVEADRSRLAQVFDNLLSNAIKFTPTGGTVRVHVLAVGRRAVVEISDTGMGISPEDQQRLFTRFFRTAAASRRAIQGTGLGLAITKAIVDGHSGAIRVRSEVGQGTTFLVELPLAVSKVVAAAV
jgi:signal transduction histidine kinase